MRKSLFIHIGTHKTGTTSIQALLRGRAADLFEHGTYVPRAGTYSPVSGHHNIAWQLYGDSRFAAERGTLADLVSELNGSGADRAVISSEDFEYLVRLPQRIAVLEDALLAAGWTPSYVAFFRRPDHYSVSLYTELLRHGLTLGYHDFVAQILRDGAFTMNGCWCHYFSAKDFSIAWRDAARGKLAVLNYDRANAGIGVIESFLGTLGAPISIARGAEERLNVSSASIPFLTRSIAGWRLRRKFST